MKLPRGLSGDEIVSALERLGYERGRQSGSHLRMTRAACRITVPLNRSVPPGTLRAILRQAGVSVEEFVARL